jgi:hypothetical protein
MPSTLIDRPAATTTATFEPMGEDFSSLDGEASFAVDELIRQILAEPALGKVVVGDADQAPEPDGVGGPMRADHEPGFTYWQTKLAPTGFYRQMFFTDTTTYIPSWKRAAASGAARRFPNAAAAWRMPSTVPTGARPWPGAPDLGAGRALRGLDRSLPSLLAGRQAALATGAISPTFKLPGRGAYGALKISRALADLGRAGEIQRRIADVQAEAIRKAPDPLFVTEVIAKHREIAGPAAAVRTAAIAAAAVPSGVSAPSGERYPRLRQALVEGRITGVNRPDPALRQRRTFEGDLELGAADQVGFGRAGDPPAGHMRRPGGVVD